MDENSSPSSLLTADVLRPDIGLMTAVPQIGSRGFAFLVLAHVLTQV